MIDLMRFCANENDPREHLRAPWRHGQWVYSTNGHVLIRVPAAQYPGHVVSTDKHPDVAAKFAKHLDGQTGEFSAMPPIDEPEACFFCYGKGHVCAVKCEHCDGKGEFIFKGREYDCDVCGEACNAAPPGWLAVEHETPDLKVCVHCDGRGFKRYQRLAIGGVDFDHGYLWWMARLPKARYRVTDSAVPGVFIGDGFHALVMPLLKQSGA